MNTNAVADRVVDGLVSAGLIEPAARPRAREVVEAQLTDPDRGRESSGIPKLVEVVAYLGGALVLAAGFLFLMETWTDLGEAGQVISLIVGASALGGAGLAVAAAGDGFRGLRASEVRRRLTGTLFVGAALMSGLALGLAIELSVTLDYRDTYWPAVAGALLVVIGSAAAYRVAPCAVHLVAMLGGTLTAAVTFAGSLDNESDWVGAAFFVVGVAWLTLTEADVFEERTFARALGVSSTLFGAQLIAVTGDLNGLGYLLTAVVAGAGVWLYLVRLDWPYLAVAVVAVTLVVPEAVTDWTDGSLGTVGGVLLAGITLLLASFAGYRVREAA